ncbi:MAG: FHA domain-containing protein [Aggregatilineales bacterium]
MNQGNDSFRLVVRRGPQPNQTYDLNKDIITLGRDITNDIVINDPEVSRHHMRMTRAVGGFTIEDLGSTNGTFINGQRLTGARPLRPGDMIGLGETVTLAYETAAIAPSEFPGAPAGTMPGAAPSFAPPPSGAPAAGQGYAPPGQAEPYRPSVRPEAPGYPSSGSSYQPPAAAGYQPAPAPQQPVSQPSYGPYSPPPAYAGAQMPGTQAPGTYGDYDPYAVREEEPSNTTRYILLGCVGLSLFCCCGTVVGLVAVDQLCLWERLPIIYDVLRALGYVALC